MNSRSNESGGKLGLVLSGGGARGTFQVGVYDRLLQDPRFAEGPAVMSGTSAGAINSAMIAAGLTPAEMMDFWLGCGDDPPVVVSSRFFASATTTMVRLVWEELLAAPWRLPADVLTIVQRAKHHWPPNLGTLPALVVDYLLSSRFDLVSRILEGIREPFLAATDRLRERLVKVFDGTSIRTRRRLAINAVDAHTGKIVRYVTSPVGMVPNSEYSVVPAITVDMVLASASIPLLFNPVQVDKHLLWDGGLLVNTPLAPAVALGAEQIITVLVTEQRRARDRMRHLGAAVEHTLDSFLENAYNVDRMLLLERNRLARMDRSPYREVRLYEALRPDEDRQVFGPGSYLNFQRPVLTAMYRAGQYAASHWLAQGPPIDHLESRVDIGRAVAWRREGA